VFSAATRGGSTSESTPTLGGVIGLLLSWGRKASNGGLIDGRLTGPEAIQVMRETAGAITSRSLPWPGHPGPWNLQYGYGLPKLHPAMAAVAQNDIPPAISIDSPDWYATFDPTRAASVDIRGTVDAPRTASFTWSLEAALGGDPRDRDWFEIGSGFAKGSFSGKVGQLDPSSIPKKFWGVPFGLSKTKELETTEQYAVSLRLTVTDAQERVAVDRRAINVVNDRTWRPGFPMRIGTSGESQPALVDLQGKGRLDIVFGDADGFVHAIDPKDGRELAGWPAHTLAVQPPPPHQGVAAGYEPVISDVAVGDLRHDGRLSVVASSVDGRVYAFDDEGQIEAGWPKALDRGVQPPAIPRPQLPYTRLPAKGALAPPVLFDLTDDRMLEVIQAGWDGYLHAWSPSGSIVPGWPVKVTLGNFTPDPGYVLVADHKLDTPPAIAFLEGRDRPPDVVVRSQYTETTGPGFQQAPFAFAFAYRADGSALAGWPVKVPGSFEDYGSAQEFITEGASAPVAADPTGTGQGPDDVVIGPVFSSPYLYDGAGQIVGSYQAPDAPDPPSRLHHLGSLRETGWSAVLRAVRDRASLLRWGARAAELGPADSQL